MQTIVVRSLLLMFAILLGGFGGAAVSVALKPASMTPVPGNACGGGAICEPWMELLRSYEPPPAAIRAPKAPKLKVRPSRRRQFG